jgi:hypothetical protein
MQLHGIALFVLGLVLIAIQVRVSGAPPRRDVSHAERQEHRTNPFVGILGGIFLVAGMIVWVTAVGVNISRRGG